MEERGDEEKENDEEKVGDDEYDDDDDEEEDIPRDALLIQNILRSMGANHNEPRVIHQFLDFWYRFVVDVLLDAQMYSEHADKPCIDCDDLKLALQSAATLSFSQPPPRETLLELARVRNRAPLPKAISGSGISLPPQKDALLAPNYQLYVPINATEQAEEMNVEENQMPTDSIKQNTTIPASQNTDQRKVTFSLVGSTRPHK